MVVKKRTGVRKQAWQVDENGGKRGKRGRNDETVKGRRRNEENIKERNEQNVREENNGDKGLVDFAQPQSGNIGKFGKDDFHLKVKIEGGRRWSDLELMAFVLNICPVPPKYPYFISLEACACL